MTPSHTDGRVVAATLALALAILCGHASAQELQVVREVRFDSLVRTVVGDLSDPRGVATDEEIIWLDADLNITGRTPVDGMVWSSANGEYYVVVSGAGPPEGARTATVHRRPDTELFTIPSPLNRFWIANDAAVIVSMEDASTGPLRIAAFDGQGMERFRLVTFPEALSMPWGAVSFDGAFIAVADRDLRVTAVRLAPAPVSIVQRQLLRPDAPVGPTGPPVLSAGGRFIVGAGGAQHDGESTGYLAVSDGEGHLLASRKLPGHVPQSPHAIACDPEGQRYLVASSPPQSGVTMYDAMLRPVWQRTAADLQPPGETVEAEMPSVWAHAVRTDGMALITVGDWRRWDLSRRVMLVTETGRTAGQITLTDESDWYRNRRPLVAWATDGRFIHCLTSNRLLRLASPTGG